MHLQLYTILRYVPLIHFNRCTFYVCFILAVLCKTAVTGGRDHVRQLIAQSAQSDHNETSARYRKVSSLAEEGGGSPFATE